jgi:hypothetical protein
MMEHKILDVLNDKIEEQLQSFKKVLCDGGANSFDHYKELSGTIRGLHLAQMEINDLVRKTKEFEDD